MRWKKLIYHLLVSKLNLNEARAGPESFSGSAVLVVLSDIRDVDSSSNDLKELNVVQWTLLTSKHIFALKHQNYGRNMFLHYFTFIQVL
jgi:hypothetical protein